MDAIGDPFMYFDLRCKVLPCGLAHLSNGGGLVLKPQQFHCISYKAHDSYFAHYSLSLSEKNALL